MINSTQHANGNYRTRLFFGKLVLGAVCTIVLALIPSAATAQGVPGSSAPITLASQNERGLANILNRVQHLFLSPITFEEVPYENAGELRRITLIRDNLPESRFVNPVTDFSVTLGEMDSTPYLAAQAALSAYKSAGRPGFYTVVELNNRVDVMPSQVLGANGAMKTITPIMSYPVSFPPATRTLSDTLQLLVSDVSRASGRKVILLNIPGGLLETVELGASGLPARDVVAEIGTALKRPVSFQCLYDVGSSTYYLDVMSVTPDPVPGGPPQHGYPKPRPTVGPIDSPFFIKK
jgi:hypothetical protein